MRINAIALEECMGWELGERVKLGGGMTPYAEAFSRAHPKRKWAGTAWRGARKVAQRSAEAGGVYRA